jgi:hypothetical protein
LIAGNKQTCWRDATPELKTPRARAQLGRDHVSDRLAVRNNASRTLYRSPESQKDTQRPVI